MHGLVVWYGNLQYEKGLLEDDCNFQQISMQKVRIVLVFAMRMEHARDHGLSMDPPVMFLEHQRNHYYGSGMDARVSVCF